MKLGFRGQCTQVHTYYLFVCQHQGGLYVIRMTLVVLNLEHSLFSGRVNPSCQ